MGSCRVGSPSQRPARPRSRPIASPPDPDRPLAYPTASGWGPPPSPALSDVEAWFRTLAENTAIAFFVYRDRFLFVNRGCEELTGYRAEELLQMGLFDLAHPDYRTALEARVRARLEGGEVSPPRYEFKMVRRDGVERWVEGYAAVVEMAGAPAALATAVDITEKKLAEIALEEERERASYLAQHDALTGLWNRREFELRLEHCIETAREEGRHHALFYLDLDEFKLVNDTSGHLAGDELLKQVTAVLAAQLRLGDTLARLGGDEFGVLLEDTSPERAREMGEALRAAVRAHRFVWQDRIFAVGVSLGTVMLDRDSGDRAQLLSAADAACYVAKEAGRNRIHEYQLDDTLVTERYGAMDWIHRIHKAFDEERFRLYQQPIEPLGSLGSPGSEVPPLCEIFIRMVDEEGQIATPSAFIQAAERYHLVPSIDRWVIHSAFDLLAKSALKSAAPGTCFAINLSGQSIGEEGFLPYVLAELTKSGVPPERLCFELTETAAIANLAGARQFIAALKAQGARFILDDFGSGLSSFAYLKNLQVDFLKIDGEFVRDMGSDTFQRAIVEAIHQVGHTMGIRTIAEGVEDSPTLEALRALGVDYAQGYWIAAPEPLT